MEKNNIDEKETAEIEDAFKKIYPFKKDNGALPLDNVYHPQHYIWSVWQAAINWQKNRNKPE